jgi:hypothetical protein
MNMRSYPLIETSLSETQKLFNGFVERHAAQRRDPAIMTRVTARTNGDDTAEHRHILRFPDGCIGHTVRELEALQGRCVQLESTFEIEGPDVPVGRYRHSDVEPFVLAQLEELGA